MQESKDSNAPLMIILIQNILFLPSYIKKLRIKQLKHNLLSSKLIDNNSLFHI
jgi:hypothetical protein